MYPSLVGWTSIYQLAMIGIMGRCQGFDLDAISMSEMIFWS